MPWLAALVCNSAFDIALHDAFGKLAGLPVYETYGAEFLQRDLAAFLEARRGHLHQF
jgi:L-alanine-DL-glutamate epimerase-like enolase superfamily enzyme